MDVLLVAAKKEKIADYTGVISQAGRTPIIVDVDAFALQNAYEVNYGLEPEQVVVLLNAGASAININIVTGDQSVFTRDISMGGNSYTEAVQKELNLPFESAEQLKRGQAGRGRQRRRRDAGAARDDRKRADRDSEDVRFLQGEREPDRIDRIVLSGGASRVDGFVQALPSASARMWRCSIRSRRLLSSRRSSASTMRKASRRPPQSPSASRSGGRVTDDSH